MLSLGLDIGSSSIKACILDTQKRKVLAQGSYPEEELRIDAPKPGWAEQDPEIWWDCVRILTRNLLGVPGVDPSAISCIGISYQMHGLVLVDREHRVLRPSIIWCDSRAVGVGERALKALGEEYALPRLLNAPGNFTAAKLGWVKEHEPDVFKRVHKIMLPGDYVAMRLTGEACTTVSGLSEGIFWDFKEGRVSDRLLKHFGFDPDLLAEVRPTFSNQGKLTKSAAEDLGLPEGAVVSYRAGDQPNNALSLAVLEPGEIAATAGTSGVVYGVIDEPRYDPRSRVNTFVHVNSDEHRKRFGVLLCINGTGILMSWLRKNVFAGMTYDAMNKEAAFAPVGSDGLSVLPFGNGAERMLENEVVGTHISGLDLNRHTRAHLLRAAQEGIAFSFKYGVDILSELGMNISVIRAGRANLFLSPVFRSVLSTVTGSAIEIFETDGAQGAAWGAAVGAGHLSSPGEIVKALTRVNVVEPESKSSDATGVAYERWTRTLGRLKKEPESGRWGAYV